MTGAVQQRLGRLVRARRIELSLTIGDAAAAAEMNPKTWGALESGTRATRDSKYAAIEHVLRWAPGSVERILNGGHPTALTDRGDGRDRYVDPVTGEEYTDPNERAVWEISTMEPAERRELIYFVRANAQRRQAEQRRRAG